jgi:hypothetical protein
LYYILSADRKTPSREAKVPEDDSTFDGEGRRRKIRMWKKMGRKRSKMRMRSPTPNLWHKHPSFLPFKLLD